MKTARRSRRDSYISIRSKLVAAVAMLLVASFMVVSSSYAWFTLSTAPEVKGIQTSVGSNGNLEIALYTGTDDIKTGVGTQDNYETWGNLIDLSEGQYGLDKIKLYPARLNVTEGGTAVKAASPLMTPVYAPDGRVEELADNTLYGSYHSTKNSFVQYVADQAVDNNDPANPVRLQTQYGVRGVGNASSLSQQQLDYRNAQIAMVTALSSAKSNASQSLNVAGSKLATIAADYATNKDANATYDISSIADMLTRLTQARQQLDTAILSFIQAAFASKNATLGSDQYNTQKAPYYALDVVNIDADADGNGAGTQTNEQVLAGWVTDPDLANTDLANAWTLRNYVDNAIAHAQTEFDALKTAGKHTAATFAETKTVLTGLVDLQAVMINNVPAGDITKVTGTDSEGKNVYGNMEKIVDDVLNKKGITVTISRPDTPDSSYGEGVYIELAKICGNFSANIVIEKLSYQGMAVKNIEATMNTQVEDAPTVDLNKTGVFPAEPTGSTSDAPVINDLYGYIIDLAFRTNAVGSKLMLQTKPVDRIYDGNTSVNTDTYGYGSNMTFQYSTTFDQASVLGLMKHIRIVFTALDGTIYAVGGLDTNDYTDIGGTSVSAPIKLYDPASYTLTADGGMKVVANATLGNSGFVFVKPNNDGATAITSLAQNQTEKLSVYVYLDGDAVQNKDVAATEAYSMTGLLNLQFSSDANLVPMVYSPLKDAGTTVVDTTLTVTDMPTAATVNTALTLPATATNGEALTWAIVDAGETGATISANALTATAAGTVTVKGTATSGATEVMTITVS